jgi:lambda repressor-like predicted transcriptional regulator
MTPQEIKARLASKNLTAYKLARRWRVSDTTLHFLIHGKMRSRDLERRLARVLGVKLKDLRNGLNT